MTTYTFQYRREQRVDFTVEADNKTAAISQAETMSEAFDLLSKDDNSDDPGELELMETAEDENQGIANGYEIAGE